MWLSQCTRYVFIFLGKSIKVEIGHYVLGLRCGFTGMEYGFEVHMGGTVKRGSVKGGRMFLDKC